MEPLTIIIVVFIAVMIWVFRGPLAVMLGISIAGMAAFTVAAMYVLGCAAIEVKNFIKYRGRKDKSN